MRTCNDRASRASSTPPAGASPPPIINLSAKAHTLKSGCFIAQTAGTAGHSAQPMAKQHSATLFIQSPSTPSISLDRPQRASIRACMLSHGNVETPCRIVGTAWKRPVRVVRVYVAFAMLQTDCKMSESLVNEPVPGRVKMENRIKRSTSTRCQVVTATQKLL